jgi:hypothetical protein
LWSPRSFLNRLQYSRKAPGEVNHEPLAVVNGDKSNRIIYLKGKPGKKVKLDASASSDPDGGEITFHWYQYREAGSYAGELNLENPTAATQTLAVPADIGDKKIHLVLEVYDKGAPALVTYRRVILTGK